ESDDFGRLLAAFGYGGRIDGGRGRLEFDAQWPGSPAAFALAGLEGRLTLEVRDGRLLEVEPGAGRVLGLLSLAQLPRRLMLDFRD
ncbi:AsmA-like C-terminal region-containing protein, partial [Acinetobacter baumannii]